jgi:hypothetical protein
LLRLSLEDDEGDLRFRERPRFFFASFFAFFASFFASFSAFLFAFVNFRSNFSSCFRIFSFSWKRS